MSSTHGEQTHIAVHSALVVSVKQVVRAHEFAKDAWFNYCHSYAPIDAQHNTVTKDPARYSVAFLGDFLQHASTVCKDEAAIEEFTSRKVAKVERVTRIAVANVEPSSAAGAEDDSVATICVVAVDDSVANTSVVAGANVEPSAAAGAEHASVAASEHASVMQAIFVFWHQNC